MTDYLKYLVNTTHEDPYYENHVYWKATKISRTGLLTLQFSDRIKADNHLNSSNTEIFLF